MGAMFSFMDWAMGGGKEAYILILGLDASGKTTLLNRLKSNEGATTVPTIGFNSETIKYGRLTFSMFDIGGQATFRKMWHHYFENCNAVVFVIDSLDKDRLWCAKDEIDTLLAHPFLNNIPFLFFANKQDLPRALTGDQLTSKLGLLRIRGRQWKMCESVATAGDGITEGFDWLSKTL
jgi:ADP-ribosylation factor protein 1